jgi:tetratricopeptide (TPR) repeat protein
MARQTPLSDRFGLPVSTHSTTAVEYYITGLDLILSGNIGAEAELAAALVEDEGFALAHAALATLDARLRRFDEARGHAEQARKMAEGTTRRERQHVEVIAAALTGSTPQAARLALEHLDDFPGYAVVMQQLMFLKFGSGRSDRSAQAVGLLERLEPAYGDEWSYCGTRSFHLHEIDRFDEARRFAELSLRGNPRNGNASHNMAHCFYETAGYEAGLDFLNGWIVDYHPQAPFYSHLNWHRALFELTQGRYNRAHQIYRETVRESALAHAGGLGPPIADATSLLWRLDLYGRAVEAAEWAEVRDFAEDVIVSSGIAFQDAHAALALVATNDSATFSLLIDRVKKRAAEGSALDAEITLPLIRGLEAYGHGAWSEVVGWIEPIHAQLVRLGGSRAQRMVFEETLLRAYLNAGRLEAAESLLRQRLEHRHTGRDFYWLARIDEERGATETGAVHMQQARDLWLDADPDAPELQRP